MAVGQCIARLRSQILRSQIMVPATLLSPIASLNLCAPALPVCACLPIAPASPAASHCAAWQLKSLIQLNFQNLPPFTLVQSQYQSWGIEFSNAIALLPSNAAFDHVQIGLLPLQARSPLQIHFQQPRQLVNLQLRGAKQIRIRAYDASDRLLQEQQIGVSTYLYGEAVSPSPVLPFEVQVQAPAIARLELIGDSPFLLRQLTCS